MRPQMSGVAALAFVAAAVICCEKNNNVNVSNGVGGDGGTGGATPQLPDCSDAGGTDPGTAGSPMIRAANLKGTCFWMDVYEASRADYQEFLKHTPASAAVPCSWKTGYAAGCVDAGEDAGTDGGAAPGDVPITCVDWCDAMAFCKWAGKTLCHGDYAAPADAKRSDWYSACTHGGVNKYSYGSTYDKKLCNGADNPANGCPSACSLMPVQGQASCKTAEGILNLNGNAAEWVDECVDSTGAGDYCNVRGGGYPDSANSLLCGEKIGPERSYRSDSIGLRCCAYDP